MTIQDSNNRPYRGRSKPRRPDTMLSGSAAVLEHLRGDYGEDGLPTGTIVALALDDDCIVLGQGRLRDLVEPMSAFEMHGALELLVGPLVADPRGAGTDNVLLVVIRDGPGRATETDLAWWSALVRSCTTRALVPGDVIVRTPESWHTLQANTRGPVPDESHSGSGGGST